MSYLLDDYNETGYDLKSYMSTAKEIDVNTTVETVDLIDLQIINVFKQNPDKIICHVIEPGDDEFSESGRGYLNHMCAIKTGLLVQEYPELLTELVNKSKTLFKFPSFSEKHYFIGDSIYKTLSARQTGLGGKFLKTPSYIRNLALSEVLGEDPMQVNLLIRTYGRYKKIFAVHKSRFQRTDLRSLGYLVTQLPKVKSVYWNISQTQTQIYVDFDVEINGPFTSGILLQTSDTGHYATTATLYVRHKNHSEKQVYLFDTITINDDIMDDNYCSDLVSEILASHKTLLEQINQFMTNCYIGTFQDRKTLLKLSNMVSLVGAKGNAKVSSYLEKTNAKDRVYVLMGLDFDSVQFSDYQKFCYRNMLKNLMDNARKGNYESKSS